MPNSDSGISAGVLANVHTPLTAYNRRPLMNAEVPMHVNENIYALS